MLNVPRIPFAINCFIQSVIGIICVILRFAGSVIGEFGFERVARTAHNELLLLPFGINMYLEITAQLNTPESLPVYITDFGERILAIGIALDIIDILLWKQ